SFSEVVECHQLAPTSSCRGLYSAYKPPRGHIHKTQCSD
ncbi:hypothetical protein KIPB_004066, partial [Kipferlia bialata]